MDPADGLIDHPHDVHRRLRDTSGHLALGRGVHHCLGAPLARAETEIALTALLERFPALALADGEPRWRRSLRARGLLALPVSYSGKNS